MKMKNVNDNNKYGILKLTADYLDVADADQIEKIFEEFPKYFKKVEDGFCGNLEEIKKLEEIKEIVQISSGKYYHDGNPKIEQNIEIDHDQFYKGGETREFNKHMNVYWEKEVEDEFEIK